MKTKLFFLVVLLAIGGSLHAQGVRFGDTPQVTTVLTPGGVIYSVANATISFCVSPANQVPCTNKVTTYTSGTLGTACPTSTQIVLATTNTCVGKTDSFGNWGVWVATGTYDYTITLPNGASVGPYTVTLASGGGGGGGGANTSLSNLSAVAINADLLPAATNTRALGSASDLWLNAFLQNLTIGGSIVFTSVAPILWTGPEGGCAGAISGKDVLCIGDATTHQILESDNGGAFNPLAKGTGVFTPGNFVSTSSTNPLLFQDSGISAGAVGGPPVGPAPVYDVQSAVYGAKPYTSAIATESTTATGTGGTGNLTLAAAKHFTIGEGVVAYAAGPATTQSTPGAPTIAVPSVTGSTTFHYECVGIDINGGLTAAGSSTATSSAPLIFGAPQVAISAISLTSNLVSVSATGITAVAGQYVSVSGVTGAGATWNGFWKVVTGGANSFTYNLTSANGTGTVGASTFAQLTNTRGVTALSRSTAGVITVTTDGNHNFTASGTNQPTLAIINGASPLDFNGTYAVLTASTNTMTLQSAISPATTETGVITTGFTTVTVWEQIIVTCPAISAPTVNYAVYGDSPNGGSTITYLGETMYGQRTFVDWGPFLAGTPQKRGYVPTLPPGAAQAQLYVGKIVTGGGTPNITVTPNITTSITSQGFLHDESQGIIAALGAASANGGGTVYLSPSTAASSSCEYALNYPVSMPQFTNLELGCAILGNETVIRSGYNQIFSSPVLSTSNVSSLQFANHIYAQWTGAAKEFLHGNQTFDTTDVISGINFTSNVNGQNFLVFDNGAGKYSTVSNSSFTNTNFATSGTDVGITDLSNIGSGGNGSLHLQDIHTYLYGPLGQGGSAGTQTGIMPFTPPQVPAIWIRGSDGASGNQLLDIFLVDGDNHINGRGILYDETFCSNCTGSSYRVQNVWNQGGTQPIFSVYGNDGGTTVFDIEIDHSRIDSAQMACFGNWANILGPTVLDNCIVAGGPGIGLVTGNLTPELTIKGLITNNSIGQNTSFIGFPSFGSNCLTINTPVMTLDCGGNFTASSFSPTALRNTINVANNPYNMQGGYQIYDAAISSGLATVTSTGFTFTSSMIGWYAHYTNCSASPCTGSVYEFPLNSGVENTIIGCSPSCPSHVAVLSQNASANVAAGSGIFTFGPNNDAGWTLLEAALNNYSATPNCPVVLFGGGYYMTRKGRFNSVTCLNPAWNTSFTSGQDRLVTIAGLGEPANAYIEPTQDFDFTTGGGNSCGGGVSNNTCFGGAQATKFMNIGIDGGGASLTGGSHSVNVVELTNDSYLFQFYCTNWGASDSAMTGLKGSSGSQFSGFLQFVGCGKNQFVASTGATYISHSFFGGTTGATVTVNSGATFVSDFNGMGYISTCPANITQWSIVGTMWSTQDSIGTCGSVNNLSVVIATTGALYAQQDGLVGAGTSSSNSVLVNGAGIFHCSRCNIQSAGVGVNVSSTGKFVSEGGNGINGTVAAIGLSATGLVLLSPTDTITGAVGIPSTACTFTSGGGSTPSCSLQSGSTAERGVIIATTGTGSPASTGTVTLTFNQTYTVNGNAPVCRFLPDDSGTAWGNGALTKVSTQSTTAPIVAWSNSVANVLTALTASSPYRIDYECVAR